MPGLDLTKASKPMPIKYSNSLYSFSDPGFPLKKYIFELVVYFFDGSSKTFFKIENKQSSSIISLEDEIEYKNITNFKINISQIPIDEDNIYYMEGNIDHSYSFYNQNDDILYIEFSKNDIGNTICSCHFIDMNFNSICASPPN